MAAQKQDDQHERKFSCYVRIRDVVLKTYLGRWTIGRSGERGSGIFVLPARYDDYCLHLYSYFGRCVPLQVFLVELGNLHRSSNRTLCLIHGRVDNSANYNRVEVLSDCKFSLFLPVVGIEIATSTRFLLKSPLTKRLYPLYYVSCRTKIKIIKLRLNNFDKKKLLSQEKIH